MCKAFFEDTSGGRTARARRIAKRASHFEVHVEGWSRVPTGEVSKDLSLVAEQARIGWSYLWGIAKINGCEWKPQDSVQKKCLKTITADCAVQESDDPHLRNEGHVQYFYVKEMEVKQTDAQGQELKCAWLAHQVFRVLCWSFKQMTEGKFPWTRHDNKEWARSDTWRREKAGMSFGGRGAVMQVRGD